MKNFANGRQAGRWTGVVTADEEFLAARNSARVSSIGAAPQVNFFKGHGTTPRSPGHIEQVLFQARVNAVNYFAFLWPGVGLGADLI